MQHIDDSTLIIAQLMNNKSFFKKVIHHMKEEYFDDEITKRIFRFIKNYSKKYTEAPTSILLKNAISNLSDLDEDKMQYLNELIGIIDKREIVPYQTMVDKTDEYIKEKAIYNAINLSVAVYSGDNKKIKIEALPNILKEAISTTLDDSMGEFYFEEESALRRKNEYNNKDSKVKFKLDKANEVTNDGVMKKSLHCIVAGPNVGKTAMMISLASDYVELGYNVLYVTCEMSEAQIGIRFDARFLNYETSEIPDLDDTLFVKKIMSKKGECGSLVVKGYNTNELDSQKLESYIDELDTKFDYKPDVVFIDYIGICSSYMIKDRNNIGTYYTKVAEEFRSVAQSKDVALWTAQQMTTDALDITDPTLKHIGYGQGIAKTADMVWFAIRTEELDSLGQLLIKQDKTRYHKQRVVRFTIGFDIGYMKLYNSNNQNIPINTNIQKESPTAGRPTKNDIKTSFNSIKKGVGNR